MMFKKLFKRKSYDIPDSWAVCHVGTDRKAMMRINTPLKDFEHKSDFPSSIILSVPLNSFDAESDLPFEFEDTMFEKLQNNGLGVIAAVVTNSETRDFICYGKDEAVSRKIETTMREIFPTVAMSVSVQSDPKWDLFGNLLPNS